MSVRIYKTDDHWWDYPYVVTRDDRSVETVAMTRRGALRAARKIQRTPEKPGFWEYEYEEL